jgi:hypothetical protein
VPRGLDIDQRFSAVNLAEWLSAFRTKMHMTTEKRALTTTKRRTTVGASPRPRKAASGDTIGVTQPRQIKRVVVRQATEAAQGAMNAAVQDIVDKASDKASALKTLLKGSSPEDIDAVRKLLRNGRKGKDDTQMAADEALARDRHSGTYPYKNLLSRKRYENQKYSLQVELLKLQAWVKETSQRVVILFEGRDAAGKGGTIKRVM